MLQLLKPERLEPVFRNKRSHCNEKPAHHGESPHATKKTQHNQNKQINLKSKIKKGSGFIKTQTEEGGLMDANLDAENWQGAVLVQSLSHV